MNTLDYINFRNASEDKMEQWFNDVDWTKATSKDAICWIESSYKVKQKDGFICLSHNYDDGIKKVIISSGCESPHIVKTRRTRHDGTLYFVQEAVTKMFENIILGLTYSYSNCPEKYEEDIFKYTTHYHLADLLWHTEYVNHVSEKEGKMFPGEQDTFACAVGIEYILNE